MLYCFFRLRQSVVRAVIAIIVGVLVAVHADSSYKGTLPLFVRDLRQKVCGWDVHRAIVRRGGGAMGKTAGDCTFVDVCGAIYRRKGRLYGVGICLQPGKKCRATEKARVGVLRGVSVSVYDPVRIVCQ